jgi:cell division protein ZapA (FtsZ GTPase activity inhibitor)
MNDGTQVTVSVLGKSYTLESTSARNETYVREVAQLVDDKVRMMGPTQTAPVQTAVLAGLELVDELLKLRAEYDSAESDIVQRTSRLASSLGNIFRETSVIGKPSN